MKIRKLRRWLSIKNGFRKKDLSEVLFSMDVKAGLFVKKDKDDIDAVKCGFEEE